ncbi:hypothetical protein BDE36_2704 [Arcticibacter tournemirensis]|uniref:Uncharacterized protein n=1 Tax=Arcticibacter tournemirensis TaxID=699437 RepID=A0A5M9HCJ2_9SPHI|nr:hypothetical protein [Arcticibacter tournemirensis]KAA8483371.1 hypothetical protein F1649_09280 [Arcticibacter tournemirensis]TQM50938.1 hypothetical protein BDE36_2704 [Arcticibacter tournemirensis]
MPSFRTHFPVKNVRTDVIVTPVEDHTFTIELESTDAFDEDTDPKHETVSSRNAPNLIVQKTKTKGWVILQPGTFDLNNEEVQALGRAIENGSSKAL